MAESNPTPYPPALTEIERVELAHALAFHFDACPDMSGQDREPQREIVETVVQRILNRRSGVLD